METKKLMIGDCVSDGTIRPNCIVTGISNDGYVSLKRMSDQWEYPKHFSGINPIALSPEILESNDFWSENNVWSWWDKEHTQSVDIYWNYGIAHVEAENNLHTRIKTNVTDVHELQHIIRMAGIDLEIKL